MNVSRFVVENIYALCTCMHNAKKNDFISFSNIFRFAVAISEFSIFDLDYAYILSSRNLQTIKFYP